MCEQKAETQRIATAQVPTELNKLGFEEVSLVAVLTVLLGAGLERVVPAAELPSVLAHLGMDEVSIGQLRAIVGETIMRLSESGMPEVEVLFGLETSGPGSSGRAA